MERSAEALTHCSNITNGLHMLVCRSAYQTMEKEVSSLSVETGGVLLGIADPPVIVEAGTGGEHAIRQLSQFSGDAEWDRRCLDRARARHGKSIGIAGYYHSHPAGSSGGFSDTDLAQARKLVEHFGDGKPLLVCIWARACRWLGRPHDDFRLSAYGIRSRDGTLEPLHFEVVDDQGECVREAISQAPLIPGENDSDFWSDERFVFYENRIGRQRIRQELQELRDRGWDICAYRIPGDRGLRLRCTNAWIAIEALLPREYPLNPPRLFVGSSTQELPALPTQQVWNSDRFLFELLDEAVPSLRSAVTHEDSHECTMSKQAPRLTSSWSEPKTSPRSQNRATFMGTGAKRRGWFISFLRSLLPRPRQRRRSMFV